MIPFPLDIDGSSRTREALGPPRLDYFLLRTQLSVLSFPLFFAICWDSLSGGRLRGQPTALLSHKSSHHLMISGHVLRILSYLPSWLFLLLAPLHATRKREAINVARVPCPQLHYRSSMCPFYPLFLNGNSAGGWSETALHGLVSDDARAWVIFQICNLILGTNYRISGWEHPRRLWREGRGNKLGSMFLVTVTVFEADHQSGFIGPTNGYTIWLFRMNALLFTKEMKILFSDFCWNYYLKCLLFKVLKWFFFFSKSLSNHNPWHSSWFSEFHPRIGRTVTFIVFHMGRWSLWK